MKFCARFRNKNHFNIGIFARLTGFHFEKSLMGITVKAKFIFEAIKFSVKEKSNKKFRMLNGCIIMEDRLNVWYLCRQSYGTCDQEIIN